MVAAGVSLTLCLTEGRLRGNEFHVQAGETFLIGRDDRCKLRLHAGKVSRVHCAISYGPDGFVVRDCVSRNGTYLNAKRMGVNALSLHTGDTLQVGPFVFRVEVSTEPRGFPLQNDPSTIHWIG